MAAGLFLKGMTSDGRTDKDRVFDYVFRDDDGGVLFDEQTGEPVTATLRFVTRSKQRALRKKNTTSRSSGGQMVDQLDGEQFANDLLDYMILNWTHVRADSDGEEVPCTRETKLALPDAAIEDMMSIALQGRGSGDGFRVTSGLSGMVDRPGAEDPVLSDH